MNNNPREHHYVPKVYLKNFAYSENGDIYQLRIKFEYKTKIKQSNISAICYKIDINTIQTEDLLIRRDLEDKYFIEKNGFAYENKDFKEILDKIVRAETLTQTEAKKILNYLINIKDRNPINREILNKEWLKKEYDNRLTKAEILLELVDIKEDNGNTKAKDILNWLRVKGDKFLEDDKNISDIHVEYLWSTHLDEHDQSKIDAITKLLRHKFILYKTTNDYPFVISDNPIFAMKFPDKVAHIDYNSFDFIGFPLNAESMLVLRRDEIEDSDLIFKRIVVYNAQKEFVDNVNAAAITTCKEFIYSNRKDMLERLNDKYSCIFQTKK
jgi:hypothetical protein